MSMVPLLLIQRRGFESPDFEDAFLRSLTLPDRVVPKRVFFSDHTIVIAGYALWWDKRIRIEHIVKLCRLHRWKEILRLRGEYWLLVADLHERRVFLLTDPQCKMSGFFASTRDSFILSPCFSTVRSCIPHPKINVDSCLDFVTGLRFLAPGDQTVIDQIHQVNPGSLLTVTQNLSVTVQSLVNIVQNEEPSIPHSSTLRGFTDGFIDILTECIKDRVDAVHPTPIASDISAGFDSSLMSVCLSRIAHESVAFWCKVTRKRSERDSDPVVIRAFAKKHHLKVSYLWVDNDTPFSAQDIEWTQQHLFPGNHACVLALEASRTYSLGHPTTIFQGHGGDEVYGSNQLDNSLRFLIPNAYFTVAQSLHSPLTSSIFTSEGLTRSLDVDRFFHMRYAPPSCAPSVAFLYPPFFQIYWETDTWPLTPFTDPRLIQFVRSSRLTNLRKQIVWRQRRDMFLPEQFAPKRDMSRLFKRNFLQKKDVVCSIFERSILAQLDVINNKQIIALIRSNGKVLAENPEIRSMIEDLAHLELFLQHHDIRA